MRRAIEAGIRTVRVNELEDLARMLGVAREVLLTPLAPGTPVDGAGRPIDLQSATAAQLRRHIREKEAVRAEAARQERSAKDRLAHLEPDVAAAKKDRDQAAATILAMDRELGLLRNFLQAKA